MGVFMGSFFDIWQTPVLHMLHKNVVTHIICEHKYFRLTGGHHCDHMCLYGPFPELLHAYLLLQQRTTKR